MFLYVTKKLTYGLFVLLGVVGVVFFLFQGFGDPSRLVLGQTGDAKTLANIRKELYLDQPKWKQFALYLRDISPIAVHDSQEIAEKKLKGLFVGGETKLGVKIPYLRRSYQSKKPVAELLAEALPGTVILALAAMLFEIGRASCRERV